MAEAVVRCARRDGKVAPPARPKFSRFFFPFNRSYAMVVLSVRRDRRSAARLTRQAWLIGRRWGGRAAEPKRENRGRNKKRPQGSAQALEKARFRKGNQS